MAVTLNTTEIEPGLSLMLFDAEIPRETLIKREQKPSLSFTILLDGAVTFNAPLRGNVLPDSALVSVSSEAFSIDASIARCPRLRSLDLHIDPCWVEAATGVLGHGAEGRKLRQLIKTEKTFLIIEQTEALRRLALGVFEAAVAETGVLAQLQCRSAAFEMLYELIKILINRGESAESGDYHDLISNIYRSLKENPERYDTVGDLASDFEVSNRVLTKAFNDRFGVSVAKAIRNARLERAHRLIERGKPVSVAGFEVGYKNASSFSSAFANHYGYAPKKVKLSSMRR